MHINNLRDIVKCGWIKTCSQRAFNHNHQLLTMEPRIVQTLFKSPAITEDKEDEEYEANDLH